ncbi:MAG: hypothetical protein QXV97_06545 [Candidatus Caldarchaeum sp.]
MRKAWTLEESLRIFEDENILDERAEDLLAGTELVGIRRLGMLKKLVELGFTGMGSGKGCMITLASTR